MYKQTPVTENTEMCFHLLLTYNQNTKNSIFLITANSNKRNKHNQIFFTLTKLWEKLLQTLKNHQCLFLNIWKLLSPDGL